MKVRTSPARQRFAESARKESSQNQQGARDKKSAAPSPKDKHRLGIAGTGFDQDTFDTAKVNARKKYVAIPGAGETAAYKSGGTSTESGTQSASNSADQEKGSSTPTRAAADKGQTGSSASSGGGSLQATQNDGGRTAASDPAAEIELLESTGHPNARNMNAQERKEAIALAGQAVLMGAQMNKESWAVAAEVGAVELLKGVLKETLSIPEGVELPDLHAAIDFAAQASTIGNVRPSDWEAFGRLGTQGALEGMAREVTGVPSDFKGSLAEIFDLAGAAQNIGVGEFSPEFLQDWAAFKDGSLAADDLINKWGLGGGDGQGSGSGGMQNCGGSGGPGESGIGSGGGAACRPDLGGGIAPEGSGGSSPDGGPAPNPGSAPAPTPSTPSPQPSMPNVPGGGQPDPSQPQGESGGWAQVQVYHTDGRVYASQTRFGSDGTEIASEFHTLEYNEDTGRWESVTPDSNFGIDANPDGSPPDKGTYVVQDEVWENGEGEGWIVDDDFQASGMTSSADGDGGSDSDDTSGSGASGSSGDNDDSSGTNGSTGGSEGGSSGSGSSSGDSGGSGSSGSSGSDDSGSGSDDSGGGGSGGSEGSSGSSESGGSEGGADGADAEGDAGRPNPNGGFERRGMTKEDYEDAKSKGDSSRIGQPAGDERTRDREVDLGDMKGFWKERLDPYIHTSGDEGDEEASPEDIVFEDPTGGIAQPVDEGAGTGPVHGTRLDGGNKNPNEGDPIAQGR